MLLNQNQRLSKYKLSTGNIVLFILTTNRESEAQTDPFTPDYQIDKENAPEVLTIAHLRYGKGLPASMAEMELIE